MSRSEYWPPLPLHEWQNTYRTLHMWTQIVGKVRITKAARDRWSSGGPAEETAEWTQHTSRSACQPEAGRILRAWCTRRVLRIWGPPRPTAITTRRRLSSAGPPLLQRSLAVRARHGTATGSGGRPVSWDKCRPPGRAWERSLGAARRTRWRPARSRSEEHTSELQSPMHPLCPL